MVRQLGLAWVAAAMLATVASAAPTGQGRISLRPAAKAEGPQVRLADVARLDGRPALDLADAVVAEFAPDRPQRAVTLEDLHRALDQRKVNWAVLALGGFDRCVVIRAEDRPVPPADLEHPIRPADPTAGPTLTNPDRPVDLNTPITLRHRVREYLIERAGIEPHEAEIRFHDRDREVLDAPALHDRLEFRPITSGLLGRVPLEIRRWSGDREVDSHRIIADVARRTLAVVATRTLRREQLIADRDVTVREVLIEDDAGPVIRSKDQVVGKAAEGYIREGTILRHGRIAPPLLVRRGDTISVRSITGGIVVEVAARALEDGQMGEVVMARREPDRTELPVRVSGRGEAVVASETTDTTRNDRQTKGTHR